MSDQGQIGSVGRLKPQLCGVPLGRGLAIPFPVVGNSDSISWKLRSRSYFGVVFPHGLRTSAPISGKRATELVHCHLFDFADEVRPEVMVISYHPCYTALIMPITASVSVICASMVRREYNEGGGGCPHVFESTILIDHGFAPGPPVDQGGPGGIYREGTADPQRSPEHALVCNGRQPMHVCACCANLLKIKADFTLFLPAQLLGCAILHQYR